MLLLLASFAHAQVSAISSFTGEETEGFESLVQTGTPPRCHDVFGGSATLCAPDADVGGIQVRDSLFLGCLLEPRTGDHLAGSNDGPAELTFDAPLQRFGGYFGTHSASAAGDLTIDLLAYDGSLLHRDTRPLGACSWGWRGYETDDQGIYAVRIVHSESGGALVDLDDLSLDFLCGSDPVDADHDGAPACVDCDDTDPERFPGAAETCDGLDDDCDGRADNDLQDPAPLADLQEGVCQGAVQVCDAGYAEPDYARIAGYESVEASCDGLDNDCDGLIDEDLISDVPATSEQACPGDTLVCQEGAWVEPPVVECPRSGLCALPLPSAPSALFLLPLISLRRRRR